jgi:OOP family OmpA-OmpF porin
MAFARHVLIALFTVFPLTAEQAQPVPSPITGTTLVDTTTINAPLEVRAATADAEAVLAGQSYSKRRYTARPEVLLPVFVATYRDALFAAGWKLLEVPKIDGAPPVEGTANIAAHYMENGKNIFIRISRTPDGAYDINIADVGEEDWIGSLAKDCRVAINSLSFDKDRPTLRLFESTPSLKKLSNMLKRPNAPRVEIQGHMDNIGEAGVAARQALSEARAKSVAAWLIADGVPAAKLSSKGYGKSKPVADNDSDLGRALNRRIEIVRPGCSP